MAIFLCGQLETGKGGLGYGIWQEDQGSWSIGYVSSLYNLGIVDDFLALA